ncbi:hypothetical protein V6N12_001263 [Hibiscus sabdariffa]|uniref:Uncharacterized protein n=1 Tax=Hibiscus sabdariffa TaxID=183260 RepID=A0ABR2C6P9_9ROSI
MVEAKNVIRMGKVQNKACWQPIEEYDRAVGKPELSSSGLNATPLIAVEPTFNNEDECIAICMGKDYFDGGNRTVMEEFRSMGEHEILGGGLNKASFVGAAKIERLSEVGKSN